MFRAELLDGHNPPQLFMDFNNAMTVEEMICRSCRILRSPLIVSLSGIGLSGHSLQGWGWAQSRSRVSVLTVMWVLEVGAAPPLLPDKKAALPTQTYRKPGLASK